MNRMAPVKSGKSLYLQYIFDSLAPLDLYISLSKGLLFGGVAAPIPARETPSLAWREWVQDLMEAAARPGQPPGAASERLDTIRAVVAAA